MTAFSRTRTCVISVALLFCSVTLTVCVSAREADTVWVSYAVTSRWTTGFSAELTIRNNAPHGIADWRFSFRLPQQITSIWNARVISRSGSSYVIGPVDASWDDGELAAGESVTIGFVARGSATVLPTDANLNGAPISFNAASPAPRPTAPAVLAAPTWPLATFAPYVDVTAWPPLDLVAVADKLGVRRFRLGFVVAHSATQATPSWGGAHSATSSFRLREVNALRSRGGDVAIVFGGAVGTELAAAARSAPALAAAYRSVIDAYGARVLDFDIEGAGLADRTSIQRRSEALAILQRSAGARERSLEIWFTLPVLPTGLTQDAIQVIRSALDHGIDIRGVNVMAMDYGAAAAPKPAGRMGLYAIEAARNLHGQLRALYAESDTQKGSGDVWRMIGITPMIGRNDIVTEVFHPGDAGRLLDFAVQNRIGLLSFWSLNRDRSCERPQASASPSCSGIAQEAYAFTRIFRPFDTSKK